MPEELNAELAGKVINSLLDVAANRKRKQSSPVKSVSKRLCQRPDQAPKGSNDTSATDVLHLALICLLIFIDFSKP